MTAAVLKRPRGWNVLAVLWALPIAMIAIGTFIEGLIFAGVMLTVSAAIPLPPIRRRLRNKLSRVTVAALTVAASIIGFLAFGATAPNGATPAHDKGIGTAVTKAAPVAVNPAVAQEELRGRFVAAYRTLLSAAKPCDQSITKLAAAAKRADAIEMFEVAKSGEEECRVASEKIDAMRPDDATPSALKTKWSDMINVCRGVYRLRQQAMQTAMDAVDGDARPSNIVSFKENLRDSQAGLMLCVADWWTIGGQLGVKTEAMK